jgi:iron complex transport system substrate-binding protein
LPTVPGRIPGSPVHHLLYTFALFEVTQMKRTTSAIAILAAIAMLVPPSAYARATFAAKPFPVTIVDDQGRHILIAYRPARIVSLFADYTEMLFALGLENRVVGDGSKYAELATGVTDAAGKPRSFKYPSEWPSKLGRDYPIRAPQITHVEGGFASQPFDLEAITTLRPDLIIAPYYKSQIPVYQKFSDLGLPVMFLNPSTINGVIKDIGLVARATGTEHQEKALVATMKSELKSVQARLAAIKSRPEVYYEVDATNVAQPYTAGPGTVPDQAIHLVRARNVADGVSSCNATDCYPSFSVETIVQTNPRVIVLADGAYGISPASVKSRTGWSTISAVQNSRIFVINPDLLSRFGPRVVIGVQALARLVHPEAFKKPA